jgi:hypothetical protein
VGSEQSSEAELAENWPINLSVRLLILLCCGKFAHQFSSFNSESRRDRRDCDVKVSNYSEVNAPLTSGKLKGYLSLTVFREFRRFSFLNGQLRQYGTISLRFDILDHFTLNGENYE